MKYKIVKNTDLFCKIREHLVILEEACKQCKNIIFKKSRVAHPCQRNIFLKEAIQNTRNILIKKVGSPTLVRLVMYRKLIEIGYRLKKLTMSVGKYGYCLNVCSTSLQHWCYYRATSTPAPRSIRLSPSPPTLSFTKEAIKMSKKLRNEKSRVAHPRQRKKCANLYLKKAGSHPVASLKFCTIKINHRHKKQKMSDGEYGYSIGPSPPGSALAWCCQTPPATRLTRPPPCTSAPPVSRST